MTETEGLDLSKLPAEYRPAVGERVEVVYKDAVMDTLGATSSCTLSVTTQRPKYNSSGVRNVSDYHSFSKSGGCSGSYSISGFLGWKTAFGYAEKDLSTFTMTSGMAGAGVSTVWTCKNSNSTTWRGESWFGTNNDGTAVSPTLTAKCG